jgi:hypothetical protein
MSVAAARNALDRAGLIGRERQPAVSPDKIVSWF